MATGSKPKGRKGKIGKKKHWIAAYYNSQQHHKNKFRRLMKHVKRYGENDASANQALKILRAVLPSKYAA